MFSINLVPEIQQQKQQLAKRNTIGTIIGISILGSCVIALLIMGGIKIAKNTQLANAGAEIERLETETAEYKELEDTVISLEKGLAGINAINDGNYTWTKILSHLESATPNDIQFTSLSLEGNLITANLKGKDIDSLARFVESYKNYQIVSMNGRGDAGEKIIISIDEGAENTISVKSNGSWVFAINFNPNEDHIITVIKNGEESKINYSQNTKKLSTSGLEINAIVANLFTSVETTQYTKENNQVNFDSNIVFSKELIW